MQLTNITTSNQPAAATLTQLRYEELVAQRKACRACASCGLINPSVHLKGAYDADEIGPFTRWCGDLDAELMVIGQDWGGTDYYDKHEGLDEDDNATNSRLCALLSSIGIHLELPLLPQDGYKLFFTNSVLCLRNGKMTGPVDRRWFSNCSKLLRSQVELVKPRVIVTLGLRAYCSLLEAYGTLPKSQMRDAVRDVRELPGGSWLVPVFHPGVLGTLSRSFEEQKRDWQRVKQELESPSYAEKQTTERALEH